MSAEQFGLPAAPEGLVWSLRRRGESVQLRLRTRGVWPKVVAAWSTDAFSRLSPDPGTALKEIATQIKANAGYSTAA
ncbi:hypothetical protein [Georgenia thermotolerans]|uniref:Uncharacterized protein n=1 Tax=Georgenia thermotolerans TaxID=527326 RepID=A0A7J5USL9_9MICO|nr:hypothetical protein [Georgenia thermotolerans]KAE8765154.1 hypothetical protein GB883_05510 [Georgenia thermotolerans]